MAKKPVLLCIMDGFGWVPEQTFGNAIAAAKKPNLDRLFETYPYTTIQASGMAVGLPEGQMGNSEVGHTNMGAARRAHAAKQRGDGSNQQQRAEQSGVKRVHPPSPPRSKESVAHGAPSASSIVSRPFCA